VATRRSILIQDCAASSAALTGRAAERGGNGLVTPRRPDGVWHVSRDIVLGLNL